MFHRNRGVDMSEICPSCDELTDFPGVLEKEFDAPTCEHCGCLIYGFEEYYTQCINCKVDYDRSSSNCLSCGDRQFNEDDYARFSALNLAFDHSYTINTEDSTVECAYEVIRDNLKLIEVAQTISTYPVLAIDTETTGLNPITDSLLLVQIATPEKVYVIEAREVDLRHVKNALENSQIVKILQNAKFDYKFIKAKLGISIVNIFDTMLAERVLTTGISRAIALSQITKKYLDINLEKSIRTSFVNLSAPMTNEQFDYAAQDAAVLFLLYPQMKWELEKLELADVAKLEFDAVIPISEMELEGVLVDVVKWREIIKDHEVKRDQLQKETLELLGSNATQKTLFGDVQQINLNSQKQVISAFSELNISLEDTSEAQLNQVDHPAAKKLLEYREHDKIITSFGETFLNLINPLTGRIHPNFQQIGADTGRLSCQNPNLQQIPSFFRSCFICPPGYSVITCDYSQAELRILAHLSQDPKFCKAFRDGGDLHATTASQMFKVPIDKVTKEQRGQAKTINFGLAYGRGPASLALQLGVSSDKAEKLIKSYFKSYSGIEAWLNTAAMSAVEAGYSLTPFGRKRFYTMPDPRDPEYKKQIGGIQRKGKNTPIQGSNADMIKYALIFINERLKEFDAKLVNTVHDEIVVEAKDDQAEKVFEIVKNEMVRAAEIFITAVPFVVDGILAPHWSK